MRLHERIGGWLDVRPNEFRAVAVSCVGGFLVMGFLVLARWMGEEIYLGTFGVRTLPYIQMTLLLAVPIAVIFGRLLLRHSPEKVLMTAVFVVAGGVVVIWPFLTSPPSDLYLKAAIVGFYLWTALGSMLLASGFWAVTCEHFTVRGAERVFGLVVAGYLAGAIVMGRVVNWHGGPATLGQFAALIAVLILFAISRRLMPRLEERATAEEQSSPRTGALTLLWRSPYLRTMVMIIFLVAIMRTVVDDQFMQAVQAWGTKWPTQRFELVSFFRGFYFLTGIAALITCLFVSRLLARGGMSWALAAVPLVLLVGSACILLAPSFPLVTAVRGADAVLRRSLYSVSLLVLFVPLPALVRRKTLPLIEEVLVPFADNLGEALGAAFVFVGVTLRGLPARYLAVVVIVASIPLLYLCRRMGRLYSSMAAEAVQAKRLGSH